MNAWNHVRVTGAATLLGLRVVAALPGPVSARTGVTSSCGATTVQSQNGNQLFVAGTGPTCLRGAFVAACRSAVLSVRGHGVDTMSALTFTVERETGGCRVVVKGSNTVFFGRKTRKTTWTSSCTRTATRAEGVVVGGCSDGDYLLSPPGAPQVANNRF